MRERNSKYQTNVCCPLNGFRRSLIFLPRSIEKIVAEKGFQFFTALVEALHRKQAAVLEKTSAHCAGSNDPQSEAARMLEEFIRNCLDYAGRGWSLVISKPRSVGHSYYTYEAMLARLLKLVELCLLTGQMDTCRTFLDRVWNLSGQLVDKFHNIYAPLVPELCKLLKKTNTDICTPPFNDFIRRLISHYLCYVLCTKKQGAKLRQIGCGSCAECKELDTFLTGKEKEHTFYNTQQRKSHLKSRLDSAGDLLTQGTRSHWASYELKVMKTHVALSASVWEYRLRVVNDMLKAIGMENVDKIMGGRYADVCEALKGQHAFTLDQTDVAEQENVSDPASMSTVENTTSVIGGKRKLEA